MTVRLTASDTTTVFEDLRTAFRKKSPGDTVQVQGSVLESKQAYKQASNAGAQFTMTVTRWSPGREATIPPLVPKSSKETKQIEKPESKDDGWF